LICISLTSAWQGAWNFATRLKLRAGGCDNAVVWELRTCAGVVCYRPSATGRGLSASIYELSSYIPRLSTVTFSEGTFYLYSYFYLILKSEWFLLTCFFYFQNTPIFLHVRCVTQSRYLCSYELETTRVRSRESDFKDILGPVEHRHIS
jgi:hypothetical protein